MIIDAHTHLFPPDVVASYERYRSRDTWFGDAFSMPKVRFSSAELMIEHMDEAGVAESIVVGWPWRDTGLCVEHNAYLAEVAANSAGRLHWMAIVNPIDPSAVNSVIDARVNGAVAIGELNADGQGFDWHDTDRLRGFADVCIDQQMPVLMHASEPTGHLYPGKGTATPEKIVAFATAFPELRIVAAHWGGGLPFYELMPEVKAVVGNVSYDTAASTYLYRFEVFETVVRLVGAGRVIFGSDYPVLTMKRFAERIRNLPMDEGERQALFAGNAQTVYGLGTLGVAR
ncbi:MAG: amidohydrolase family protein [Thermomicrobiales bacterium]